MSPVLPLKESSRKLILEVARALEPHLDQITAAWRAQLAAEFGFEPRVLAALKRLTPATLRSYFGQDEMELFFENLSYYGDRLAKLGVDTRAIARSLEIYQSHCEPHLPAVFGDRAAEAAAALEALTSASFVTVADACFNAMRAESQALLSVLDMELAADNLNALLDRAVRVTAGNFGAGFGMLLLREPESDQLTLAASVGFDSAEPFTGVLGEGFIGGIAARSEADLVLDAPSDSRVLSPLLRRARTLWGVPLVGRETALGVLVIGFDKPYYEWLPSERQLMRAMADRSALAIERARMTEALRERQQTIARLSAHLLTAQEEERMRISRELHDETGQALMVIRLYLGMLEEAVRTQAGRNKIGETLEVVDRTIDGIRRIIARLSPLVLEELGLHAAIRKEAKDLARRSRLKVRVAIADGVGRLAAQQETALYRILQEALHNVVKHAEASNVAVQMARDGEAVRLLVEDDGVGINHKAHNRGSAFGLAGMRERVAAMSGSLRITSSRGKGTRIEITVPVAPVAADSARKSARMAAAASQGAIHAKNQVPTG